MKSIKLIIFLLFSFILGNDICFAQQTNTSAAEQYIPSQVKSRSSTKAKTKKKSTKVVNTAETAELFSKSEKEARALTAKKSKNSGKANIPPEKAKKERAARIAAIIEANKTKKKTPSKRNNN